MLFGVWAVVILRKASGDFLSQYRITGKFIVFQVRLFYRFSFTAFQTCKRAEISGPNPNLI